jgi:hypothetical protein
VARKHGLLGRLARAETDAWECCQSNFVALDEPSSGSAAECRRRRRRQRRPLFAIGLLGERELGWMRNLLSGCAWTTMIDFTSVSPAPICFASSRVRLSVSVRAFPAFGPLGLADWPAGWLAGWQVGEL